MNEDEQKGRHTAIQQLRAEVKSSLERFEEDITNICEEAIDSFKKNGDEIRNGISETLMTAQQNINRRVDDAMDRMIEIEDQLPEECVGWWARRRARFRWVFID